MTRSDQHRGPEGRDDQVSLASLLSPIKLAYTAATRTLAVANIGAHTIAAILGTCSGRTRTAETPGTSWPPRSILRMYKPTGECEGYDPPLSCHRRRWGNVASRRWQSSAGRETLEVTGLISDHRCSGFGSILVHPSHFYVTEPDI